MPLALLAIAIVLAVTGQLFLKHAATSQGGIANMLTWRLFVALGCYASGAICYTFVLRYIPLSLAYPSTALGIAAASYLAHRIWGEPFGAWQVLGISLIVGGVSILHLRHSGALGS